MRARMLAAWFFLFALALSGCAGQSRKTQPAEEPGEYEGVSIQEPSVDSQPIPESYGPELPDSGEAARIEEPKVLEPLPQHEPKLCLVLGPGMARAIAHAAVLEALKKTDIPVHCVVGSEMGAVVGALYAHARGSTNTLQWQLFKFNKDNYFDFPLISLREPKSNGRKLHDFLRGIFRDRRIEDLPIRFGASATDPLSGDVRFLDKGNLADALSASLALPGIFEPWRSREAGELVSGAVSSPAPIELARGMGGTFFVLIDVIEDGASKLAGGERFQKAFAAPRSLLRLQRKEASFLVSVKAANVSFDDFSRQGEILSAGAQAAEAAIDELKAAWEKTVAEQKSQ